MQRSSCGSSSFPKELAEVPPKICVIVSRAQVEQVNDSSESVMANIAEGFGRGTQGEFVTFLGYAIGSLNETQSHESAVSTKRFALCLFKDLLGPDPRPLPNEQVREDSCGGHDCTWFVLSTEYRVLSTEYWVPST